MAKINRWAASIAPAAKKKFKQQSTGKKDLSPKKKQSAESFDTKTFAKNWTPEDSTL